MSSTAKVLIVDDYKTMLRILRQMLTDIGLKEIDEASDGTEALELLRSRDYDLILSDWNMAPMTGLDLLRAVRSSTKTQKTPFVLITAEAKVENVATARAAGVTGYMIKPFNAATLKTKIAPFLGLN